MALYFFKQRVTVWVERQYPLFVDRYKRVGIISKVNNDGTYNVYVPEANRINVLSEIALDELNNPTTQT